MRRALNVLVAILMVVVALPLMLLIALVVKVTSPGPVIFKQLRVGLDRRRRFASPPDLHRGDPTAYGVETNGGMALGPDSTSNGTHRHADAGGRLFVMYKFRTMIDQPKNSEQVWAGAEDPRITSMGSFLRKYRLDELPQLFNVLANDMNVVGPRPEQPAIFHDLRRKISDYPVRQRVRPGITGLAQVHRAYDQSLEDVKQKLQYDIRYLEDCSPLVDLQIMARTLPVMLFKLGSR